MGLERRGGGFYFYRKVRRGDRVVSEYAAGSRAAPLMAEVEALDRERWRRARADWEAERGRMVAEDAALSGLFDRIEAVARAVLEAAGYHRHKRGEWRRRRMAKGGSRVVVPRDADDQIEIMKRAQEGDESALPQLKAMFDDSDAEFARHFGDLAGTCDKALLRTASGKNLLFREGLERRLRDLREELAGPRPSTIERLLAERAATCWLALHAYELRAEQTKGLTPAQAEYYRRRIDSAHRRYLSALKALATVRKLALPSIQVNIGENQVNMGGV